MDDLEQLIDLKSRGILSEDEYQSAKEKIIGIIGSPKKTLVIPPLVVLPAKPMGWLTKAAIAVVVLVVAFFLIGLSAKDKPDNKLYTGVIKVSPDMEYVALNKPSTIGGACEGWSAVAIQRTGTISSPITNLICWKLVEGRMAITDKVGSKQTSGPVSAWSD